MTTKKKKKKQNNVVPVLIVIGLIAIVVGGIVVSSLVKKYSPSKEYADLKEYYGITEDSQVALILNDTKSDSYAKVMDGSLYLDYGFVHDEINPRFYWDYNENILLYTTATDLISAEADASSYLITKSSNDFGSVIVKANATSAWVNIDFVKLYSNFEYEFFTEPNRIVLRNSFGEYTTVTVKKDSQIRFLGGIKSDILCDVPKGTTLTVLEEMEEWDQVATKDGIIGYVRRKVISGPSTATRESNFQEEVFTHITKNFDICLAWHQMTNRQANANVANVLKDTKGINVISPTWFYLDNNNGGIANLCSSDYVSYCHSQGVEVWALVSNLENAEVDTSYVLTHTSTRQNLVNQLLSAAIQYNLDGINVDLEALTESEVGDGYIQFIRELSLKCANNGIVVSVDNYVPTAYTAWYQRAEQANFADYVIIMAYDEHYRGSEEAGSVASLNWVTEGVDNTLKEVPADQIILGMPFYTKIWCKEYDADSSDTEIKYNLTCKDYGMKNAANTIADNKAEKQWLEDAGQYYAEWTSGKDIYMVWIEDATSLEQKLTLMQNRNLAGAAFWKLGFQTSDVWDTVIKYMD